MSIDIKALLEQNAPPGYVAGSARGDTGFTTSAETGGARITNDLITQNDDDDDDEEEDERIVEDDKGLLISQGIDKDDIEADKIYEEVERKLNRKRKNEDDEVLEEPQNKQVVDQFAELKRGLSSVSTQEWASLPDAGDFTRRNKRNRLLEKSQQRFYAAPDSLIANPSNASDLKSNKTNFQSISESKDLLLGQQLDMAMVRVNSEQLDNTLDLKAIETENAASASQVADIEKGRQVLSSLRKTYPNRSSSWISSARLEEQAKNFERAKELIEQGCVKVPYDPEVWLESIRIHQNSAASSKLCKVIVTEALKFNNSDESLWLKAVDLENPFDVVSRKRILMRALESLPDSTLLWKEMISIEQETTDAVKLLKKAIELCPSEWDFYLSLISHSSYKEAKSILNSARKNVQNLEGVWITALKLEEGENESISEEKLKKMFTKGMQEITNGNMEDLDMTKWLDIASQVYDDGYPVSSEAIAFTVLRLYDDHFGKNVPNTLLQATRLALKSAPVSHYVYQFLISENPNNIECWAKLFASLKSVEPIDLKSLFKYYKEACDLNRDSHVIRLMYAKDKWTLGNSVSEAREILEEACETIKNNQEIWFARIKLEIKTSNYEKGFELSSDMVRSLPNVSARVWYKHIHLLRCINYMTPRSNFKHDAVALCDDALGRFPENEKLYLQKIQLFLSELQNPEEAREIASVAVKIVPSSINLWITLSQINEKYLKSFVRARSVLDAAILKNPQSCELWDEKIWLERRSSNSIEAKQLTNKALKLFPASPTIWKHNLSLIAKSSHRKNAFVDALKKTDNSSIILLQIGIFFWLEGSFQKANLWFERAIDQDEKNGDSWAWLYLFITKHGSKNEKSFFEAFTRKYDDINRGNTWNRVHKAVENFRLSPIDILKLTSESLINLHIELSK